MLVGRANSRKKALKSQKCAKKTRFMGAVAKVEIASSFCFAKLLAMTDCVFFLSLRGSPLDDRSNLNR
jgi:hypothetical protein